MPLRCETNSRLLVCFFLLPQLKSVAHMPWKSMVYKSLNTFIDDLFAFVIKVCRGRGRIECCVSSYSHFIHLFRRCL